MVVFNFYVNERVAEMLKEKLGKELPGHKKGLTASFLRISMIKALQDGISDEMLKLIEADYITQATKNKRGQTKM